MQSDVAGKSLWDSVEGRHLCGAPRCRGMGSPLSRATARGEAGVYGQGCPKQKGYRYGRLSPTSASYHSPEISPIPKTQRLFIKWDGIALRSQAPVMQSGEGEKMTAGKRAASLHI